MTTHYEAIGRCQVLGKEAERLHHQRNAAITELRSELRAVMGSIKGTVYAFDPIAAHRQRAPHCGGRATPAVTVTVEGRSIGMGNTVRDEETVEPGSDADLASIGRYLAVDPGIRRAVQVLRHAGVETFESCEGGKGHACPEPIIRFYGDQGAGWHALSVALSHGFPVLDLRLTWHIDAGKPTGPCWEMTLKEKLSP